MKKIIGVLGVVMIAATMFFSANNVNSSNGDLDLANLITMSSANAEIICPDGSWYSDANSVGYEVDLSTCYNTQCVCKNGVCSEANWISFRTECGNTAAGTANTNENCAEVVSSSGGSGC